MAVNEEVEAYLRSLYQQPSAEFVPFASPEAAVAFQPDLTPMARRPRFGSMLEGEVDPVTGQTLRKPAIQAVREARMDELAPMEAEAEAASLAAGPAALGLSPLSSVGAAPSTQTAMDPLTASLGMQGAGGPMPYMDALAAAQREDALAAAFRRVGDPTEQLARIQSRGIYQPMGLTAMPSAVSELQQRQAAVSDFLRQQRESALSAAQLDAMRALAEQRRREPAERVPLETEAQRRERLAKAAKTEKQTELLGKPKPGKAAAEVKLDPAATKLRTEFNQLPEVKTFNEVDATYRKMQSLSENPSPAGDIALVFSFMKLIDPGSTVREGEQAQARNAAGVPDQVRNQYNRLLSGESLTADQRKDFSAQGLRARNVAADKFNQRADFYSDLARRSRVKVEDVLQRVTGPGGGAPEATQAAAAPAPAGMVRIKDNKTQRVKEFPEADAMKLLQDKSGRFEVVR